ncbi:hypothetical protein GOODEAATRI_033253, partial [Goodea atripinnis]
NTRCMHFTTKSTLSSSFVQVFYDSHVTTSVIMLETKHMSRYRLKINSTPPSVTLKELTLEPLVPIWMEVEQWTIKTCRLLCSPSPPSAAVSLFSASCLEQTSRWVTRRCQERQRCDRSGSETDAEEDGPL